MRYSRLNPSKDEKIELDLRDKKIASVLSENSRIPISAISKEFRLNRDTVRYKIQRMEDRGFINQFFARLNFQVLGYQMFYVFFSVTEDEQKDKFIQTLVNHPNTFSVMEYNDTWDIGLRILARDLSEFDMIMSDLYNQYSSIIIRKEHLAVITNFYSSNLPYPFYKSFKHDKDFNFVKLQYDEKYLRMAKLLAKDARMSAVDIAKKLKMNVDTAIKRLRNLSNSNLIHNFSILTDRSKIGYRWYTVALRLKHFNKKQKSMLKQFVKDHPYIIRCERLFGSWDLFVTISAKESKEFHATIKELKTLFASTLKEHQIWIAYKEHIFVSCPKVLG